MQADDARSSGKEAQLIDDKLQLEYLIKARQDAFKNEVTLSKASTLVPETDSNPTKNAIGSFATDCSLPFPVSNVTTTAFRVEIPDLGLPQNNMATPRDLHPARNRSYHNDPPTAPSLDYARSLGTRSRESIVMSPRSQPNATSRDKGCQQMGYSSDDYDISRRSRHRTNPGERTESGLTAMPTEQKAKSPRSAKLLEQLDQCERAVDRLTSTISVAIRNLSDDSGFDMASINRTLRETTRAVKQLSAVDLEADSDSDQADLASPVSAGAREWVRPRSKVRESHERGRTRQGVRLATAGLGVAALAGLYEKHKPSKEAKQTPPPQERSGSTVERMGSREREVGGRRMSPPSALRNATANATMSWDLDVPDSAARAAATSFAPLSKTTQSEWARLSVQKHPADLDKHRRTHSDDTPFVYAVCGKLFARDDDWARHRSLHSGPKITIFNDMVQDIPDRAAESDWAGLTSRTGERMGEGVAIELGLPVIDKSQSDEEASAAVHGVLPIFVERDSKVPRLPPRRASPSPEPTSTLERASSRRMESQAYHDEPYNPPPAPFRQQQQQQQQQAVQAEVPHHQRRQLQREPTKTISPKDALLDYNEQEQPPVQDSEPTDYQSQRLSHSKITFRSNAAQYSAIQQASLAGGEITEEAIEAEGVVESAEYEGVEEWFENNEPLQGKELDEAEWAHEGVKDEEDEGERESVSTQYDLRSDIRRRSSMQDGKRARSGYNPGLGEVGSEDTEDEAMEEGADSKEVEADAYEGPTEEEIQKARMAVGSDVDSEDEPDPVEELLRRWTNVVV